MTSAADSSVTPIEALERSCRDADRAGDMAGVYAIAEHAAEDARRADDHVLLARAQCWMAQAHLYRGALRECLVLTAQTEGLARDAGDDPAVARLYSLIGNCEFQLAQHAAARETLEAGIALADAHGFVVPAATMRGTLGSVLGAMGRFDEGEAAFNASIAELEAEEDVRAHPWQEVASGLVVTVSVGYAQLRSGESLDELARRADEAMYAAKRSGRNQIERA
jgi:tetratricopeptide (TPR) repeat protein